MMTLFPLSELLEGVRRLFVGIQGKKEDGSYGTVGITNEGELKVTDSSIPNRFVGYSTEAKPTGERGDSYIEIDTKKVFIHDGRDWVVF